MGSTTKGSGNVATQISKDSAGQTIDWEDDVIVKVDADEANITKGIFLKSNDGSVWKLSVTDAGVPSTQEVS